ncbi:D-alanyl-D-alanine carboxypeptidase family protein [Oceanobacillus sp. CAU 1775]
MRKYYFPIFFAVIILIGSLVTIQVHNVSAAESKESVNLAEGSKSAILIEQDTGTILFNKNPHEKLPPASMTKIMTLLLIMEAIDNDKLSTSEAIRISENASSMGGTQIFLGAGEEMLVEDLIKGIAIASANDASVALAERIAGSEQEFVKAMNEKAKSLGLENTQFQNSSGLPAKDHYSTAYDMAVMARELLKYDTITNYTSIYEDYLRKGEENEFWLVNTNKLVRFHPDVDGLKTGYTSEAKYCLTATAKQDDMRVVAVVMGYDTSKERNAAVSSMIDYAFNHFETKSIYKKGDKISEIDNLKAKNKVTNIVTTEDVSTLHAKGEELENLTTDYEIFEVTSLPIKTGDVIGRLSIKNGDEIIHETNLTVEKDIEHASFLTLLKRSLQKVTVFE